jgi:hypothetical protein
MTLTLNLPATMETRLREAADRLGVTPDEFALKAIETALPDRRAAMTGADLIARWESEGVLGIWADRRDIPDSPEYARELRHLAERRGQP